MNCPACKDAILVMSERQGVEIDYCPKCRGTWLDWGELDKIVERSMRIIPGSAPQPGQAFPAGLPGYDHAEHDHDRHKDGYRKKSLWKELFD